MPFAITDTGIQIQSLEEIKEEWNTALRGLYGENFKVANGSVAAKVIGTASEREALLQQLVQTLVDALDPNNATGVILDILSALTDTQRASATKSKSSSFLATGTPAVVINNGRQFKLIQTGELWNVVDGPYVIGGGGTIAITAEADETGPKVFQTTGPAGWEITLGVVNWTSVESTADIDPEDTGRDVETDAELRERRKDELVINGNDLEAVRAAVLKVTGVTLVRTFENTSPSLVVDGIDPGAFETVVDGGDDTAIAVAIQSRRPPGAKAFGSIVTVLQTSTGDNVSIGHTRPTDIDFWILVTCLTAGAEGTLPPNAEQTVLDTILADANARFNDPDFDVIPKALHGAIFDALRDSQGRDSISSVDVKMSLDNGPGVAPAFPVGFPPPGAGVDPYTDAIRPITIRERGDFDSARIGVTIT